MELPDCPPGAEGYEDTVIEFPRKLDMEDITSTKAELEFKEHLASLKIKVEDGSTRPMVDRQGRDVSGKWIYLCYPCAAVCSGESILQTHISGKKHKTKLSLKTVWPISIFDEHPWVKSMKGSGAQGDASEQTLQKMAEEVTQHNSDPDEMDQRFSRYRYENCQIQKKLDAVKAPLLGLEYLVEFPPDQPHHEPAYICLMCDKQGAPRTIVNHLVCHVHRMKYLRYHFSVTCELLNPFRSNPQYREGVAIVLNRLAQRIEDTYGRLKPLVIDKDEFKANKDPITKWVWKSYHFSDKNGVTFAEVVDKDLITSLVPTEHGNVRSSDNRAKKDPSPPVVAPPARQQYSRDSRRTERRDKRHSPGGLSDISPEGRDSRRRERQRSRDNRDLREQLEKEKERRRERERRDRRSEPGREPLPRRPSPPSQRERSPLDKYKKKNKPKYKASNHEYKMEIMKEQVREAEVASSKTLSYYEKNPEKHPLYPEEWKKFWNKRYKELQAENKDPSKHDFKPEWIVFWTKRMKELHDSELRNEISEIRRKLNLPLEESDRRLRLSPGQKSRSRSPIHRNRSPDKKRDHRSSQRDNKDSHRDSKSSKKDNDSKGRGTSKTNARNKSPSLQTVLVSDDELKEDNGLSPWNDSDSLASLGSLPDLKSPPLSYAGSHISRSQASERGRYHDDHSHDSGSPDDVVSTLRLLVALEDYLGSLGPKIVDLLTQALKMEKEVPNSSEQLLEDERAAAQIETAKEKLKGAVQAGLMPGSAASAAKRAITRAAALLHVADRMIEKKKREAAHSLSEESTKPLSVAGVGAVDKAAIAKQMAAALIAQGKTDVTTEELAQLVEAVVGMAEAKKRETEKVAAPTAPALASAPARAPARANVTMPPREPSTSALQLLQSAYDENEKRAEKAEVPSVPVAATPPDVMDGLSDSDLKTLLQNFSELSAEEQHGLIAYLKKLEARSPKRVEKLREYVSEAVSGASKDEEIQEPEPAPTPVSALPAKTVTESLSPVPIESDDDDYTVDEIFKSAAQKVKENQMNEQMAVVQKLLSQSPQEKPKLPENVKVTSSAASLLALVQASVQASSAPSKPEISAPSQSRNARDVTLSAVIQATSMPRSFGDTENINPAPVVLKEPEQQNKPANLVEPVQDYGHRIESQNQVFDERFQGQQSMEQFQGQQVMGQFQGQLAMEQFPGQQEIPQYQGQRAIPQYQDQQEIQQYQGQQEIQHYQGQQEIQQFQGQEAMGHNPQPWINQNNDWKPNQGAFIQNAGMGGPSNGNNFGQNAGLRNNIPYGNDNMQGGAMTGDYRQQPLVTNAQTGHNMNPQPFNNDFNTQNYGNVYEGNNFVGNNYEQGDNFYGQGGNYDQGNYNPRGFKRGRGNYNNVSINLNRGGNNKRGLRGVRARGGRGGY